MAQTGFASRSTRMERSGLAADIADMLRIFSHDLFDSYRPERHYMRGPGPKWHAKHDRVEMDDVTASAVHV